MVGVQACHSLPTVWLYIAKMHGVRVDAALGAVGLEFGLGVKGQRLQGFRACVIGGFPGLGTLGFEHKASELHLPWRHLFRD